MDNLFWIVEALGKLGSIAGLISVFILIYGRLFRDAPIFDLVQKDKSIYFRIKNVSDKMLVLKNLSIKPRIVWPVVGNSVRASARAAVQGIIAKEFPLTLIAPFEERFWGVMFLSDFKNNDADTNIDISIEWRGANRPWPWKRKARFQTSVKDLKVFRDTAKEE